MFIISLYTLYYKEDFFYLLRALMPLLQKRCCLPFSGAVLKTMLGIP